MCLPKDDKHPESWDRYRECMTKERFVKDGKPLPTMKDIILEVAEQRNDDIARRVKLQLACVSDLPSAECKYHVQCYNSFMKIPKYADLPTDDRGKILHELSRTNIANGRCAPPESEINVADSVCIGECMTAKYKASLPTGSHSPISRCIKTMEHIKKGVKVGDQTIFDLETNIF